MTRCEQLLVAESAGGFSQTPSKRLDKDKDNVVVIFMAKPPQGFSSHEARDLTGASQRRLDYWADLGLVVPSVVAWPGKGRARRYSFADLLKLRMVCQLRAAGLSLQKIQKAMKTIDRWDGKPGSWAKKMLITDGNDVFVTTSDRSVLKSVLKGGQLAFSVVLLGEVLDESYRKIVAYQRRRAKAAG